MPWPSATGGSGRDVSSDQPSTTGMNPEKPQIAAGRGRPTPSPSAKDITHPCENPPSTTRACGSESSHSDASAYDEANVGGVRIADPRHDVPVRAARRQRQRPARAVSVQPPLGIEHVEQRKEIVLVGAAAVEEHERAGRLAGGGALADDHAERSARRFGSGVRIRSTWSRYCS